MTSSSRPVSTSTLTSACARPHADRAIFLRICEDRGIEDYGTLQNLIGKPGVYRRLMARFEDADKRYNSGLFDFRKDTVTPSLKIDDKLLSDILSEELATDNWQLTIGNRKSPELYPPKSPYEFSVIGIEILGEVYEQFLGKVIRLTAGHQAKVEEGSRGLVPTCALDGSSAPRKLSAMPCEPRPALTEAGKIEVSRIPP